MSKEDHCIVKYPDASIGELAPCGSRQMDMLACPLGSLPAGIKVIEKEQGREFFPGLVLFIKIIGLKMQAAHCMLKKPAGW